MRRRLELHVKYDGWIFGGFWREDGDYEYLITEENESDFEDAFWSARDRACREYRKKHELNPMTWMAPIIGGCGGGERHLLLFAQGSPAANKDVVTQKSRKSQKGSPAANLASGHTDFTDYTDFW